MVDEKLFMTWHAMSAVITWTWDSCGGAQCRGVLSGKGHPRTYPRATPCGYLSKNCQYGEVVPSMDCDAISVEYGVKNECFGHIN